MASELPQVQCINDDIDNKDSYNDTTTKDDYGIGVVQNVSVQLADPKLARRVVRKIDLCVLLCMFVTYNLTFIDKYILASASVLGLTKDTHLHGSEYGWVGSIFYFGWLVWEYPAAVLVQKLPVGKYIAGVTFIWGAVVAVTASTSNFGGLAVCRILLGMAEATISPAFIFITSTWYTRSEIPFRLGIWSSGNSIGSIIASICAYGIGQIEHPLHPWQWLFIIFGIATSLWSIVLFFFLPDSIDTAIFLDEEEKRYAQDRVVLAGTGRVSGENKKYKFEQVIECFKDPKTYFSAAITILTMIPNGGTGTFGNLALKSFGFTNLQTMLVNLPVGVIAFITINITGWIASRYQNMALILLMITVIPPVVGCALIAQLENKGVRLFGYYCLQTGVGAFPHILSLIAANFKGVTKKMTMSAVVYISYCVGNIIGPQTFLPSEASRGYPTGFNGIMSCYALTILLCGLYRCYLMVVNKRTSREMQAEGENMSEGGEARVLNEDDYNDITDWNTLGFRYRM